MSDLPELVICAAMQMDDGYVIRGHRHDDCMQTMGKIPRYRDAQARQDMQGFVTSRNRFVGRSEAAALFRRAGLASAFTGKPLGDGTTILFSEDLY